MTSATALTPDTVRDFGPWNPGIQAGIPERLLPLCTLFRPENVFTSVATARELRDLTGLELAELVAFRPQRLALHELMIRVSADLSVPDGTRLEDLGINFRDMVRTLYGRAIAPKSDAIDRTYDSTRRRLAQLVDSELGRLLPAPGATGTDDRGAQPSGFLRFFGRSRAHSKAAAPAIADEATLIAEWKAQAHESADPAHRAVCRALSRVLAALHVRHGRVWGGRDLIASIVTGMACNDFGSDEIGALIGPWLREAAQAHGYRLLPHREEPVVMNTKGPSASGKSTIRPLQRQLAGAIGVDWSEFALISPDIWRKQLIDYAALGAEYKYGGALSADELAIVDQKLDRYMARKAERGEMTHLLIDRFRFDSFARDSDEAGSNLLTRFGRVVYLFFMITPPAALVERAWTRGLEVGRYKAVDDTLAHAVEAYTGMPQLFFTWIGRADKRVHFEFLDNSVRYGERPLTVAFGSNEIMNVLDARRLIDVERYRGIDVDARGPERLYRDPAQLAAERNTGFLRECVARFREVNFADQASGRVYLRIAEGRATWADREAIAAACADADTRIGLLAVAPDALSGTLPLSERPCYAGEIEAARPVRTVGRWGDWRA
ncbi:MAG TPA: hypothetical protein VF814_10560 [Casimicrobiaceae bacterium]